MAAYDASCHVLQNRNTYWHLITAVEREEYDQAEDRGLRVNQAEAHFMSTCFVF